MQLQLRGKRAMVCGSTQGIGHAAAIELAELGAEVILVARREDALKDVLQSLPTPFGQQHHFIVADFNEPEVLAGRVKVYVDNHRPIHILVNNTGGPPGGPILEAEVEAFFKAYRMHLACNHLLVQALAPGMKEAQYGRIIQIISISVKEPIPGLGVSNTTRGAVASWAKTLSKELAPFGITVNNVLPGFTETQRLFSLIEAEAASKGVSVEEISALKKSSVPAKRFAKSEEVAYLIAFLASSSASYINGVSIPIDGGRISCI